MPTDWENSYVDRLRTLSGYYDGRHGGGNPRQVIDNICGAIEPLILPDAAKILTAIATDLVAAIESRNDRLDVNDAFTALRNALALLEAVSPDLDG